MEDPADHLPKDVDLDAALRRQVHDRRQRQQLSQDVLEHELDVAWVATQSPAHPHLFGDEQIFCELGQSSTLEYEAAQENQGNAYDLSGDRNGFICFRLQQQKKSQNIGDRSDHLWIQRHHRLLEIRSISATVAKIIFTGTLAEMTVKIIFH